MVLLCVVRSDDLPGCFMTCDFDSFQRVRGFATARLSETQ